MQKKIKNSKIYLLDYSKFRLNKPLNLFIRLVSILYLSYCYNVVNCTKVFFFVYFDMFFLWFDYLV